MRTGIVFTFSEQTQWDNGEAREYMFADPTGKDADAIVARTWEAVL